MAVTVLMERCPRDVEDDESMMATGTETNKVEGANRLYIFRGRILGLLAGDRPVCCKLACAPAGTESDNHANKNRLVLALTVTRP
ncbi:MAG: hypothetical protein Q9206_002128 [Seirophora lacunosa]